MGRKGMQLNNEIAGSLDQHLEEAGYGGKSVAIEHLGELESEIMGRRRNGLLDPELYEAYLASFDFTCHRKFKNARSLIIVSAPQPQVRLFFVWQEQAYPVIIPPTYSFGTDKKVADLVKTHLNPRGYRLQKVRLPEKLLAVRSGLARYGKNNITYVAGMGSFHRIYFRRPLHTRQLGRTDDAGSLRELQGVRKSLSHRRHRIGPFPAACRALPDLP